MGELLSVAQWAERYGKDERNARRLIAEGRLAAVRIGGRWAIDSGKYRDWRKKPVGEPEQ